MLSSSLILVLLYSANLVCTTSGNNTNQTLVKQQLDPERISRLQDMFRLSHKTATEKLDKMKEGSSTDVEDPSTWSSSSSSEQDSKDMNKATKSKDNMSKIDARQSSLFNSLKFPASPTFGNAFGMNPSGLSLPPMSMPQLPTLPPLMTPRPSRAAKSSIIGNNGGSMALTNDNVVVVNVLSNNYR